MVEFITNSLEKKKTETLAGNKSQRIVVFRGQRRASHLSLANLFEFQHGFIFSYIPGTSKDGQKGRGVFKCKREGYAIFKANHVQDVKYNFSSHSEFCLLETKVRAFMYKKQERIYMQSNLY